MYDPVEVRRRIEQLAIRIARRDDYGQLLATGEVIREVTDLEVPASVWRAWLRKQARADCIPVRTGRTRLRVWAVVDRRPSAADLDDMLFRMMLTERVIGAALRFGHDPAVAVVDGDESVLRCPGCGAEAFIDSGRCGFIGGELIDTTCPAADPDA